LMPTISARRASANAGLRKCGNRKHQSQQG